MTLPFNERNDPGDPTPFTAISRQSAEHYQWGEACDGWHLVRAMGLSVIEELMPPGTSETRHLHRTARQFFYVLKGRLTIEIGSEQVEVMARTGVEIPPEMPHRVRNESSKPAEFLVISQPPGQGDRYPAAEG